MPCICLLVLALLATAVSGWSCAGSSGGSPRVLSPYTIGAYVSDTGTLNGIKLALRDINATRFLGADSLVLSAVVDDPCSALDIIPVTQSIVQLNLTV